MTAPPELRTADQVLARLRELADTAELAKVSKSDDPAPGVGGWSGAAWETT